jgi:16S rRNA (cytidine1402-2'-O)-methyltransferase
MSDAGELFLVATPIGNLADITQRAVETLAMVDVVAAEDTRVTAKLMQHLGLHKRLVSYHDHNEEQRAPWLIERLLAGENVALVSDAGTPLQSDPGFRLLALAIENDIAVRSLPGPSAVITALVGSGLPLDRFCFLGFLPRKAGARQSLFRWYRDEPATLAMYEAPHRLLESLADARNMLGDRRACIGWNLTKEHERYLRGTLSEIEKELGSWPFVHGEITLLIDGVRSHAVMTRWEPIDAAIRQLLAHGLEERVIRDVVAELCDLPKREVYERVHHIRDEK